MLNYKPRYISESNFNCNFIDRENIHTSLFQEENLFDRVKIIKIKRGTINIAIMLIR